MPRRPAAKSVETLKHDADKRKNIPTAELQSVLNDAEQKPVETRYARQGAAPDAHRPRDDGARRRPAREDAQAADEHRHLGGGERQELRLVARTASPPASARRHSAPIEARRWVCSSACRRRASVSRRSSRQVFSACVSGDCELAALR